MKAADITNLPDGWTGVDFCSGVVTLCAQQEHGEVLRTISIDVVLRTFAPGMCRPTRWNYVHTSAYAGRGWKTAIVADAVAWLNGARQGSHAPHAPQDRREGSIREALSSLAQRPESPVPKLPAPLRPVLPAVSPRKAERLQPEAIVYDGVEAEIARLGLFLRARRERLRLTREEVCNRAALGLQTLVRIEGGSPGSSLACVYKAARALGIRVEALAADLATDSIGAP